MRQRILIFIITVIMIGCNSNTSILDVQGHRGCRGLLPENSLPAFQKALELGVTTLEMDLVISADDKVVISHEPFFNHEISSKPDGSPVEKNEELSLNLYKMSYDSIKTFDVGKRPHPRFKDQVKMAVYKPLFSDLVEMTKSWCTENERPLPYFNIEIKRREGYDDLYHPNAAKYAKLVVDLVKKLDIQEHTFIQSFDMASLQSVKKLDQSMKLVLLVEKVKNAKSSIDTLGFIPAVYSPLFKLIDQNTVDYCNSQNIQLIPWTVNETIEMSKMIELGVDGIITDFPDLLLDLLEKKNIQVKH